MSLLGYFEPIPVMLVVVFTVYLATEPAAEVESEVARFGAGAAAAAKLPITSGRPRPRRSPSSACR